MDTQQPEPAAPITFIPAPPKEVPEMVIDPALENVSAPEYTPPVPPPPPPPPPAPEPAPAVEPPPAEPLPETQPEEAESPPPQQAEPSDGRSLNVMDALAYLDDVKVQFQDQSEVYNQFLDIMKDFKSQIIDTPGVIRRVSYLFRGHPSLIQGFNTFLPSGYRIDARDTNYITVTTPHGTHTHAANQAHLDIDFEGSDPVRDPTPPPANYPITDDSQAIEPAVQYVQKIKQQCDPDTYRQFLDILSRYHHTPGQVDEEQVSRQISELFKDAPELRADFSIFMPGNRRRSAADHTMEVEGRTTRTSRNPPSMATMPESRGKRRLERESTAGKMDAALPAQKRKRRMEKDKEREREEKVQREKEREREEREKKAKKPKPPQPPISSTRTQLPRAPPLPAPANPDQVFFDHVRRALDSRETYQEFLTLVNLFTQDYIDAGRLVKEARNFLGEGDLYLRFCSIVGWDERKERERRTIEHATRAAGWGRVQPLSNNQDYEEPLEVGSYRRVAERDRNVECKGRDELCKSVLNDEWVAHPSRLSEEQGFIAHKKNMYEEALHRSEEERHEYDFHIDAITRTIAILEPICSKINQLAPEDRPGFKLKHGLAGIAKAIHGRVVKKIYGREAGNEVMKAVNDVPGLAVPVVLARLRQKEEEWRKAQREWNKVWREVDARNYYKSLDHQAITFKAADKRTLTARSFLSQIEAAKDEQMGRRAALVDPLFARTRPRYHLKFMIEDRLVLQDTLKLVFSFLDRTSGQMALVERRRIESFLRSFVSLFFVLDPATFSLSPLDAGMESELSEDEPLDLVTKNGKRGGKATNVKSDLRKNTLKNEQAKSTGRRTRASSPAISRFASPVVPDGADSDVMNVDGQPQLTTPRKYLFFANGAFYTFLRILEVLYTRLLFFKQLAKQFSSDENYRRPQLTTNDQNMPVEKLMNPEHYYGRLLESCERLFDNELEQHAFEEQMRLMFGVKDAYRIFTVDKVIGSLIKQVQTIIGDARSQELLEPLKRERALASPTTQDQMNNRKNAEKVLGPDENLFRFDWHPDTSSLTIQLIGKDDDSEEIDSEVLTGRWQEYLSSYVSADETYGVNHSKMRNPFLHRNMPRTITPGERQHPRITARNGLEIKICVRTYRMFYVSGSEDCFRIYGKADPAEELALQKRLERKQKAREEWIEKNKARETAPVLP